MSFLDTLISLPPVSGFNILVATIFALVIILLIWQGSWSIIMRMARPQALWGRVLRIVLALIIFVVGGIGTALVAEPTALLIYLLIFSSAYLGMALQSKSQHRQQVVALALEAAVANENSPKLDDTEIFAAAVELQLKAADIEVGLFRSGISPLEKRTILGKKTIRNLR